MTDNKIRYFIIILTLSVAFSQCRSTKETASQKKIVKSIYIDQFKLTYFRLILRKSFNNSDAVNEILKADNSGYTEPVITEDDFRLLDSITTADNTRMVSDSAQGRRRAEGAQGKRPLGYIVERINSNWLDSLANQRLKLSGVAENWLK